MPLLVLLSVLIICNFCPSYILNLFHVMFEEMHFISSQYWYSYFLRQAVRTPAFIHGLAGHATSTPYVHGLHQPRHAISPSSGLGSVLHSTGSSGLSSIHGADASAAMHSVPSRYEEM